MNPDEELKVQCLDERDSWALFKVNVRERALNSDPLIQGVAKRVAKECGGLPLALVTVGKAMSSRYSIERWEYALSLLQSYPYELQDMEEKVFYSLKFSYDSLEDETIRECFLYCSLFPDDYFIHEENLIRYWMGEGLLGELENLKKLKNRGHEIIGVLESACLLERETGRVRMHDVIRDVALWIVSGYGKQEDKFFVHPGRGLTRTGIRERWKKAHKIFVMNLTDLPVQPSCTNLSTFIFWGRRRSLAFRNRD